jgi:hypothetical protein
MSKERSFRAWYTHDLLVMTLSEVKKSAKRHGIKLDDPDNPTPEELAKVYKREFEEMSDPWEITANGKCKVEEV